MLQRRERWMFQLIHKILANDTSSERPWLALLDHSSIDLLHNVKYVKVDMYRYEMANPLWVIVRDSLRGEEVVWWTRQFEETLIRPVQLGGDGNLAYASVI